MKHVLHTLLTATILLPAISMAQNVGIGTTTPTAKVHIVQNANATGLRIRNANTSDTANLVEMISTAFGNFNTPGGGGAYFGINNDQSIAAAVKGETNTVFGNGGAAGIYGLASGTGGYGGYFQASNTAGSSIALLASNAGTGNGLSVNSANGTGAEIISSGTGRSLYAWKPIGSTGSAAEFANFNNMNNDDVLKVHSTGNGNAAYFNVNNTQGTSAAVKGEVNSIFANFGTAGVYGLSSGTGGYASLFYASNPAGTGPAVLALTEGGGNGVTSNAGGNGNGVESTCDGSGNAVYGWVPNFGAGRAARFANFNSANGNPTVHISTNGTGAAFLVNHTGPSGNTAIFQANGANVARIDRSGRGYFNNGTMSSGADVAEYFEVEGAKALYEPGDVLVISTSTDRTVEASSTAYSNLIAGVYATKPGVLLTEKEGVDTDLTDMVPMGVVGVIPTKVCLEGGIIKRGDMVVSASLKGHAMKADAALVKPGQVIGKALENFDGTGGRTGKIRILVNVK